MPNKTTTLRFMVLAEQRMLSNQPCYVRTIQGMGHNRIDQDQIHKRPDYIPTQV